MYRMIAGLLLKFHALQACCWRCLYLSRGDSDIFEEAEAQVLLDGALEALAVAEDCAAVLQQDLQQLQGQHLQDTMLPQ